MNSDILSGSCYFYPRSPCGERPGTACMGNQEPYAYFYPRSPCGERRWPRRNRRKRIYNFYPRSPCGERQATSTQASPGRYFYPRSPCGERHAKGNLVKPYTEFLSTLSLRRATCGSRAWAVGSTISIHALLAESDFAVGAQQGFFVISIHALLAESDFWVRSFLAPFFIFLSTLSLRRATRQLARSSSRLIYFYPRSPCGERRVTRALHPASIYFYPRSPCGERPDQASASAAAAKDFYPRSPCGERRTACRKPPPP